jgi:hypothetical protein
MKNNKINQINNAHEFNLCVLFILLVKCGNIKKYHKLDKEG